MTSIPENCVVGFFAACVWERDNAPYLVYAIAPPT